MKNNKWNELSYTGENIAAGGCGSNVYLHTRLNTHLKNIRIICKITQAELAEKSGVSLRTLQDYEQGRKPINQAAAITVHRIAQALGVTVEDLLEET